MAQALVAQVIVVAQVGEYLAELLFGQNGLERVAFATGVVELHAPCSHQGGAEPLTLVEHGLIGMAYQLLEVLGLPVYGDRCPSTRQSGQSANGCSTPSWHCGPSWRISAAACRGPAASATGETPPCCRTAPRQK